MKRNGFVLLRDKRFSFQKDVINLVDRVLESAKNLRGKDINGRDLEDLLQIVRSSTSELLTWKDTLCGTPTAFVLAGFHELRGGASHYWNEHHLSSIVVELEALGFDVVFVCAEIQTGLTVEKKSWLSKYMLRCQAIKEAEVIECVFSKVEPQGREIEALSRSLAGFLKDKKREKESSEPIVQKRESKLRIAKSFNMPKAELPKRKKVTLDLNRKKSANIFQKPKKSKTESKLTLVSEPVEEPTTPAKEEEVSSVKTEDAKPVKATKKPKRRGRKASVKKIDYNSSVIVSY